MRTLTRTCLTAMTACALAFSGYAQYIPNPVPPGTARPQMYPSNEQDSSLQQLARTRRDRMAQDRFDRLKLGSDRLRDLCTQLQSNLGLHATPDEADRKLMAEIEKQTKALRSLMVQ